MSQGIKESPLTSLSGVSGIELENVVRRFREQRAADVRQLIEIVTSSKETLQNTGRVPLNCGPWHAINLLGEMRSPEAAKLLAEIIDVRDSSFSVNSEEVPQWYSFPAAVALSKIGMPAIEHLLVILQSAAPNSTAFQLAGTTLEAILSDELALATVKLYGREYPALGQDDRMSAATKLIQTGHKRWSAGSADDFTE